LAYQQAGDAKAQQQWLANSSSAVAPPIGAPAKSTLTKAPIGFALQVGAFTDKKRAQQAASEAEPLAKKDGLGPVRVIPRRDDRGKSLYLVQFGFFTSRDAASAARTRLGRLEYIVTPVS
jgi:septal ring-binding cell division protein DamX